ncbi:heterokaryon incompatibility protein-domain-containing protein [Cerioporus squamosus]|nr:heterokaryon incompatibility protein-domain-containing protein [Cerioporus squamosus]
MALPSPRELVCESCWHTVFSSDAFQAAWGPGSSPEASPEGTGFKYTTPPWEQMVQQAIESRCRWCELVCNEIRLHRNRFNSPGRKWNDPAPDETFQFSLRFEPRSSESPLRFDIRFADTVWWRPKSLVVALPDDNAARYIPERDVLREMDTYSTYALAKRCIEDCIQHHPRCPPPVPATLPTRVIDCADPAHPRLYISNRTDIDFYVALSYVWGEDQPHRTSATNLASYTCGLDTQYIPSTIRDAITVTHKLGLRYLWVDAFCIIQDSEEDKAVEISRIKSVFRNAYITIIAASARKVSDGFLHDRSVLDPAPVPLPFRCPDGTVGTMLLQGEEEAPFEPINTRAWCLEERVLSPRALLYCTHTLQYECQTLHTNVNGTQSFVDPVDGIPRLPDWVFMPASGPDRPADAIRDIDDAWAEMVRLYTTRALTSPRDRLLALSGVAEQFHHFWQEDTYLCGMWDHQLPGGLLWFVNPSERCALRPQRYRAPSWSWAAVDGAILPATDGGVNDVALCSVRHCNVTLAWPDRPYGEVTGGELVLDAMVRKAVCDPTADLGRGDIEPLLFEIDGGPEGVESLEPGSKWFRPRSSRGEIGYVRPDVLSDLSVPGCEVSIAIVRLGGRGAVYGLVIVPLSTNSTTVDDSSPIVGSTYRRVGTFVAPFCDKAVWLGTPRQVISIL